MSNHGSAPNRDRGAAGASTTSPVKAEFNEVSVAFTQAKETATSHSGNSAVRAQATDGAPRVRKPRMSAGPRKVHLAVTRIDPWSVMKLSFLLSIALGIVTIVATASFWTILNELHVFTTVDELIKKLFGDTVEVNVLQFVERSRVLSVTTIIAAVNVVLITILLTIAAFLYNIVAKLVGGIHVTLTDD